ncbi:MAG: hypothetical protein ACJ764_15125 [Solirubrobacteraceae bacterium]
MGTAWRYRLFRAGRMPAELKTAGAQPGVLLAVEGVSLKISGRSIALPGVRSGRSVNLAVGSIVLSPDRLLTSYGKWPILNADLAETPESEHELTISPDGVHLHVSVPEIYEGGRGTFELHYRTPIKPSILTQIPSSPRPVRLPEGIAPLARRWA